MNELVKLIARQLADGIAAAVGDAIVKKIGEDALGAIALAIADRKERYERETDPDKKRQLEKSVRFLKTSLMLEIETRKIRLSNVVGGAVRGVIEGILKVHFPFL